MSDKDDFKDISETQDLKAGSILSIPISQEMKKSYLDYAMSVIVARALPDIRDGLKPVHRRLIFAAHEIGLTSESKYRKSATLVGEVMGKYHPHGDVAIYDSLVRMAQNFSLRYPLIDGQGNFGNVDGDPPAAMRYTECRLEKIADYLIKDIEKNTVEFVDNFSAEHKEPTVLPSVIPNLFMNGSSGIAVGMATNIPPHNLNELIDGINLVLDSGELKQGESRTEIIKAYEIVETTAEVKQWEVINTLRLEEMVKVVKGPDFPTGCTIYDQSEILNYFATGKGRIVQRAKAVIDEGKNGKYSIVITEIPYQVTRSGLVEKIADLVNNKKVREISDIRDVSNKGNLKIIIELKREARPQKVLNYLYKYSPLQTTFNANMLALINGEPQLIGLKTYLDEFIKHRRDVITRRTLFLLKKAREREHILEGLKKALDIIDEIVALIRKSKDSDEAKAKLIQKYKFTEIQAQAILDMQLRRLAALEREKIENELRDIQKSIKGFLSILSTPKRMIEVIKEELLEVKEKFGDARRTKVIKGKIGEFNEEDLIANEQTLISLTDSGYVKRMKPSTYKAQGRGGKGIVGMKTKDADEVSIIQLADTHDRILFMTDNGRLYEKRVWDIPESSRTSKGTAVVNIIDMPTSEKLAEMITIPKNLDDNEADKNFIIAATRDGQIKKTELSQYTNIRKSGITAMGLKGDDKVVRAKLTNGENQVILVTALGKSIRFRESDVRPMGRSASGVRGINLKGDDYVVSMEIIPSNSRSTRVLIVTSSGYGKSTKVTDYPLYNRGGSGVKSSKVTAKTGNIVAVRLLDEKSKDVLLTSEGGQIIRLESKSIPVLSRDTQGVILMRFKGEDSVSAVSVLTEEPEIETESTEEE